VTRAYLGVSGGCSFIGSGTLNNLHPRGVSGGVTYPPPAPTPTPTPTSTRPKESEELLHLVQGDTGRLDVGPGRCCSPCSRMSLNFNSRKVIQNVRWVSMTWWAISV